MDLQRHPWCSWEYRTEPNSPKPAKPPINPHTGKTLSSTSPEGWLTYADVADEEKRGFRLSKEYGTTAIDLDGCRDEETGTIDMWAQFNIDEINSYTEVSPSGTGVHIIIKGLKPENTRTKFNLGSHQVEVYDSGRFMTYTGEVVNDVPVVDGQWWIDEYVPLKEAPTKVQEPKAPQADALTKDDQTIVMDLLAVNYKDDKFKKLWQGDYSDFPQYKSDSEADAALCTFIAYGTKDRDQIDRIFRASGMMRGKWLRPTYRIPTIASALRASNGYLYEDASVKRERSLDRLLQILFTFPWDRPADFLVYSSMIEIAREHGFGFTKKGMLMFASIRDIRIRTGLSLKAIKASIHRLKGSSAPVEMVAPGDEWRAARFMLPWRAGASDCNDCGKGPLTSININLTLDTQQHVFTYSGFFYSPLQINFQPLTPKQTVALHYLLSHPTMVVNELFWKMGGRGAKKKFNRDVIKPLADYVTRDQLNYLNLVPDVATVLEANEDRAKRAKVMREVEKERRIYVERRVLAPWDQYLKDQEVTPTQITRGSLQ